MPLKLQQHEELHINLTSMVDVVFLLLIFFMVASKFAEEERSIDLQLPKVGAAGQAKPDNQPRRVALDGAGGIQLDGRKLSLQQLQDDLKLAATQFGDVRVVIDGDARCPFQGVAAAMAACREAGVTNLSVTVELAAAPAVVR